MASSDKETGGVTLQSRIRGVKVEEYPRIIAQTRMLDAAFECFEAVK